MLRLYAVACILGTSEAFTARTLKSGAKRTNAARCTTIMSGLIGFATMSGNTERIAGYIGDATGISPTPIADVSAADLEAADCIICGAPTWNTGADDMRSGTDIDDWLYSELPNADLSGKKVALFGLGDSAGYSGNFCDSVGELYDCFTARGATVVGFTDQDGYDHYDSKAIRDDKFCGLMCDEQNQMDQSEDRATAWVEQLKAEGMPL
ncbi:unnamed protein product [Pelagomonas calceolata]|uniref:Flavodoxin-like domain-containing protein n=1 Tax=Pelagomonas calceolata TaxID=35677 RepID=A0A8J2WZB9_9STRA|nr:unnamed protein product [Pelagomonas calceolata]